MSEIIIPKDLDDDLIKILAILCINIQNEFDISPKMINILINNESFSNYYRFLHQQCYGEMINNINHFKENFDMNVSDITAEEYEKCGHLITSHQNTYISYCNAHKYLHPHPSIPNYKYTYGIDHTFVVKNTNQIIKERYNTTIYLMYQNFINKLYKMIKRLFDFMINVLCHQTVIKINDEELSTVIKNMERNPSLFKSRIIYEHIDTITIDSNKEINKFYYIKSYQVI